MTSNEEYRQKNTRMAAALKVGGFRPTFDPLAPNLFRAPVAAPGEEWPRHDGVPLAYICQFNLTTAPAVPELLRDMALITFFALPDLSAWCVRAYHSLDGLAVLAAPVDAPKMGKAFECEWEACEDHPNPDDPEVVAVPGARRPRAKFDNLARTKIGGYASTIQSEPWWGHQNHPANPRFCFQINSEPKAQLAWGDGGTVYIARGTAPGYEDQWYLDWQCF